ncbi:hypothetical protein C8Q76DRAFT_794018 [Earliella scabrosa]|nr:hypothetical protein C8Q76DRAFT_794018 [Earliella scabrosa]
MAASSSRNQHHIPIIHEVNFDHPGESVWRRTPASFEQYILLKQETYYDHRAQPHYSQVFSEGERWVEDYPADRLARVLAMNDAPTMLEVAVRRLAQCDPDDAKPEVTMSLLQALNGRTGAMPDVQWPGRVANITPQIRKRALAVAAWMYFQLYFLIPEMHPGSLYAAHKWPPLVNAAFVANDCAQEGFVPAIVTRIPSWLMVLQRMHGVDLRGQGKFSEARLPDLWKAYDDYLIRQRTQEERRLGKISKAPHQYRCAAEGCGIQVLHKSFLAKCGGQCLPDSKPHYCSQQCQERHWLVHQYACKTGQHNHPIVEDDRDPDWVDVETYRPTYYLDEMDLSYLPHPRSWAQEIFIDIPYASRYHRGDVIRLRSRTFGPEFLRTFRKLWQLPPDIRVERYKHLRQYSIQY